LRIAFQQSPRHLLLFPATLLYCVENLGSSPDLVNWFAFLNGIFGVVKSVCRFIGIAFCAAVCNLIVIELLLYVNPIIGAIRGIDENLCTLWFKMKVF
jgi:hypothetical protein